MILYCWWLFAPIFSLVLSHTAYCFYFSRNYENFNLCTTLTTTTTTNLIFSIPLTTSVTRQIVNQSRLVIWTSWLTNWRMLLKRKKWVRTIETDRWPIDQTGMILYIYIWDKQKTRGKKMFKPFVFICIKLCWWLVFGGSYLSSRVLSKNQTRNWRRNAKKKIIETKKQIGLLDDDSHIITYWLCCYDFARTHVRWKRSRWSRIGSLKNLRSATAVIKMNDKTWS